MPPHCPQWAAPVLEPVLDVVVVGALEVVVVEVGFVVVVSVVEVDDEVPLPACKAARIP